MVADELFECTHQHLTLEHACGTPGDIEKAQHIEFAELLHPFGIVVETTRGIETADQRADRAAGDGGEIVFLSFSDISSLSSFVLDRMGFFQLGQ